MFHSIKKIIKKPLLLIIYFRLYFLYKKNRFQLGNFKVLNKKFTYVDSASFVSMYVDIFINESYKFKTTKENPLIFDCGANIGLSVLYFKTIYPKSVIKAFEPDTKIFKVLNDNCSNFKMKNVTTINNGVWINNDEVGFFSDGSDGGRIEDNSTNKDLAQIKMLRLKDLLKNEKEIDLLKMDIEGAEVAVLNDCVENLQAVKLLFVEYHSSTNNEQKLEELLLVLKKAGFRYYINSIGGLSNNYFLNKKDINGFDLQLNIYAIR